MHVFKVGYPVSTHVISFSYLGYHLELVYKHHNQSYEIVATLGEVTRVDASNDKAKDAKCCINTMVNKRWVTSIILEFEEASLPPKK